MPDILLLLFILLRPFYMRMTGKIQPFDGLLMAYFLCIVYKDFRGKQLISNLKKNALLYAFLILAMMINCLYYYSVPDVHFLMSSLYLVYIGVAVYCYSSGIHQKLIDRIRYVLYLNILIQFLIYCFGWGRVYFEVWENAATRYMGTFMDPNQLGFFVFIHLTYAYLTKNQRIDRYLFPVMCIIGTYLAIQSKSLSALLGLVTLFGLILIRFIYEKLKFSKTAMVCGLLALLAAGGYFFLPSKDFRLENVEYTVVNRIRYKLYTIVYADGVMDILRERAAEKIVNYPEYFIYGAGEGNYDRYYPEPVNEIHSSFLNLFYSYGIIPFSLLIAWFKQKMGKLDSTGIICLIAILVESTFLVNYRQALFWITWITLFYRNVNRNYEKNVNNFNME